MNSLFISLDLGTNSSGNLVSVHELEFLKSISNNVIQLGYQDISPMAYNLPDIPFLMDYLTMNKVSQLDLTNIYIAHSYGGPYTNTIRYLKAKGIKTSLTCDAHNRKDSIEEFESLGYPYPYNHVADNKLWDIYSGATRYADVVIVPSKISAEFLKKEGVEGNRIRVIPHGIDIPENYRISSIPKQFNVGYLGAMGPDKGITYLIQSWNELNYKDSTLIFAGRNSEQLGPFINRYATTGRFNLIGYVKDVGQLYNISSVYVQPSVTEGFGIEVLEAMSYGRPVIVSDGAGAADMVTDGVDGFVVPKRDPKAIADKITWFRDNPKELKEMGENAKEKAKIYSWDNIQQLYINLWKSLCL